MLELVASFSYFSMLVQDAIHRPPVAKVLSFIQQRGIDLAGRAVLKAFAVENLTHLDLLLLAQSSFRRRPWLARFLGLSGTV
jgi:hypothetical protein